ncbi:WbqC family protein [Butyrivibrio sp. VCB2001]|uniref:WbqC family protein n=1 Tax=Butyrivibrio sp. VCB2001 TaxID=1280667 RepID=UPI00040CCE0A|nr:WbqC family protein [Butyrivibrio sp. VCB2001]
MKIGIMQPYFFPYIGYWQLMNAVDEYLIADNVNYIKNGYINRNKIELNGEPFNFGVSVRKASQNRFICDHEHNLDRDSVDNLLKTLRSAYANAPYFENTFEHVKSVLEFGLTDEGRNLATFLENAIRTTAVKLGIATPIYRNSVDVPLDGEYKREYYVVALCKKRGADVYYNAIGGTGLYFQSFFRENGLGLKFVKSNPELSYARGNHEFIPNLSIIDVMMYCDEDQIKELLSQFTLIDGYEDMQEKLMQEAK